MQWTQGNFGGSFGLVFVYQADKSHAVLGGIFGREQAKRAVLAGQAVVDMVLARDSFPSGAGGSGTPFSVFAVSGEASPRDFSGCDAAFFLTWRRACEDSAPSPIHMTQRSAAS